MSQSLDFSNLWAACFTSKQLGAECAEPEKDIWGVELLEKMDEYEEKD